MSQAMTNAFNQWNKMLIDQNQWDAQRNAANADFAIRSVLMEEQAKDAMLKRKQLKLSMDAQRMQNELTAAKVRDMREYETPMEFSMYNIAGMDWINNPNARDDMRRVFSHTGEDVKFRKSDGAVVVDGKPLELAPRELEKMVPMIDYVRRRHTDRPALWMQARENIQAQLDEIKTARGQMSGEPRYQGTKAALFKQQRALQSELDRLNNKLSQSGLTTYYDKKASDFENAAAWMSANHMDDAAKYLTDSANFFRQAQANIMNRKKQMLPVYNIDPTSPKFGMPTGRHVAWDGYSPLPPLAPGKESYTNVPSEFLRFRLEGGNGASDLKGTLSHNNAINAIDDYYTQFIEGINDPAIENKKNFHADMYNQLITMQDEEGNYVYDRNNPDRFAKALADSREYMRAFDERYTQETGFVRGLNAKQAMSVLQNGIKTKDGKYWLWSPDESKAFGSWAKDMKGETPNANNILELMEEWRRYKWKLWVRRETGIPMESIYNPSEFKRSYEELMSNISLSGSTK